VKAREEMRQSNKLMQHYSGVTSCKQVENYASSHALRKEYAVNQTRRKTPLHPPAEGGRQKGGLKV